MLTPTRVVKEGHFLLMNCLSMFVFVWVCVCVRDLASQGCPDESQNAGRGRSCSCYDHPQATSQALLFTEEQEVSLSFRKLLKIMRHL